MKKHSKRISLLFLSMLLSILLLSCNKEKEAEYIVEEIKTGELSLFVEDSGQIKSVNELSMFTGASLKVEKVYFKLGDTVKKGDVVITFDPSTRNDALRDIEKKQIEIGESERDLYNSRELFKIGGAPKVDIGNGENKLRKLNLELASLQENFSKIDRQIVSPIDGVITEMIADDNYRVNTDTPLFKISDIADLLVKVSLADADARHVELGQKAIITSDALTEGEVIEGIVTKVSNMSSKDTSYDQSNTEIEIKLNDSKTLRTGDTVNAKIYYFDQKDIILVPYASVVEENNKYYVYMVDKDSKVYKKEITVGKTDNVNYQILSGLSRGQKIITNIDPNLKEGIKVKTLTREEYSKKNAANNKNAKSKGNGQNNGGGGGRP